MSALRSAKARWWLLPSAALLAAPAALAQTAPGALPEVVVTGQKAPRALEDVQASVAVVTADEIAGKGLESFRDAFRVMGNVIDADWADAGFILRGVNSEGLTPGGSPLATVYIDGAAQTVQGARRGARGLWDVQQVEVYRGPQSTLSGRASLAGAIYVKTRDPEFEWDGALKATAGTQGTVEGGIALGGPLAADTAAFRIAAEYVRRENQLNYPRYERYARFDDFSEDEYYQVRGKLLLTPGDGDLRILTTMAYSSDSPTYDDIAGPGLGFEYSERRGDLNADLPFFQDARSADNLTASVDVSFPVNDRLTFTSLTAWSSADLDVPSINEGTPGETFVGRGFTEETWLNQEFRLNYDSGDGGLVWVAGLYAAEEDSENERIRTVFFGGGRTDSSFSTLTVRNYAAFAEATVRFAPTWKLVAGGRVLQEELESTNRFVRDNFDPARADLALAGGSDTDATEFLPKAGLIWEYAESRNLAFTAQRGYRSGGSGIDIFGAGVPYDFDPEYVWNYELASRNRLADGRLLLNANIFYTQWDGQQVEGLRDPQDPTSGITVNAGKSRLFGGELEVRGVLSSTMDGFLSLGYVDTEFQEFESVALGNLSGLPFPEAPEFTLAAGLDYENPSGFFAGFDAKYVDEYVARDPWNAPLDFVGDYVVANVRLGWRTGRWTFTVFSENVFDEQYFVYRDVIGGFDCCATVGRDRLTGATIQVAY